MTGQRDAHPAAFVCNPSIVSSWIPFSQELYPLTRKKTVHRRALEMCIPQRGGLSCTTISDRKWTHTMPTFFDHDDGAPFQSF